MYKKHLILAYMVLLYCFITILVLEPMVFCCRQVKIRILEFLAVQKLRGAACTIGFEVAFNLCRFIVWKSGFHVDLWIYYTLILGLRWLYIYIYIYIDKYRYLLYIYILNDVAWFGHQMVVGEFLISRCGEVEWNPHENPRTWGETPDEANGLGWVDSGQAARLPWNWVNFRATNSGSTLNKHIFW